jgi:TatD DNase family protein
MQFFNLHTHHFTNQSNLVELVNQYPNEFNDSIPFYTIGIHPWKIKEECVEKELVFLESKLSNDNCLAIGECGLDKRIAISLEIQIPVFEKQLKLAEHYKKPVIIHCVAAFQEVIEIKNRLTITVPIVIHGFSKNEQVAKQLLDNGFYLSFGKYLLRNPELESVFKSVPNERFLLETDTCEETIESVYALAARYKQLTLGEMQQQVAKNFKKLFF